MEGLHEEILTVLGCNCKCIDLGYSINESTIFWPGGERFSMCMSQHSDPETGKFYAAGVFSCPEHGGTHVDAPWHFSQDGATVDMIPLRSLIAPCRVVDVQDECLASPNYAVSREDILEHEQEFGDLVPGSIVLIRTGWHSRYPLGAKAYLGFDELVEGPYDPSTSALSFPGIAASGSALLVERAVAAVGLDTASLDPGANREFDAHYILLGGGVYGIEYLGPGIASVPVKGSTLIVMPVKLSGGSGGPARVVALCPVV